MSDKKAKTKKSKKAQSQQDKPKPYPLRSALQGVPPTSHGISVIPNKKGVVVTNLFIDQKADKERLKG
ncbi:MAG: hypothetical protein HZA11_13385 [Nitrospirae bacterium]|nr:hypothetical protein [Nitrospirota bacterium]